MFKALASLTLTIYGFMMFMLIINLPIHFDAVVTWSTEYLAAFRRVV